MTTPRTTLRRASRFTITPEPLILDRSLSNTAVRLWMILDRMCAGREVTFPSRQMLADALPLAADGKSVSLSTVDRAVRDLCAAGWLMKERANRGDVNAYVLLEGPVVTSDDTPSRHQRRDPSSPETTPVVTGDEQEDDVRRGEVTPPASQGPPAVGEEPEPAPTARQKGTRLPEDWEPSEAECAWAHEAGLTLEEIPVVAATFRDYWISVPGKAGVKLKWDATWRNWVRREVQNPRRRSSTEDVFAAAERRAIEAERMMTPDPLALPAGGSA